MELRRFALYRVIHDPAAAGLRRTAPSLRPGEVVRFLKEESAIREGFTVYTFSRARNEEDFLRVIVEDGEAFDLAAHFEFVAAI